MGDRYRGSFGFLKGVITVEEEKLPGELAGLRPNKKKLRGLATRCGVSVQEAALNFVLQHPQVASVIIGVDSIEELKSNVMAIEKINAVAGIVEELRTLCIEDPFLIDPRRWESL